MVGSDHPTETQIDIILGLHRWISFPTSRSSILGKLFYRTLFILITRNYKIARTNVVS